MSGAGCSTTSASIRSASGTKTCSLTLQPEDLSIPNLIASGLFGDGAAAVVVTGEDRPAGETSGPRIAATRSVFYPDSERVMGWDISETGFKIILSGDVPVVAREKLRPDVDAFLTDQGLTRADIASWVCHPGGPKVIEALQQTLGLSHEAVRMTWESLARVGNLSSASVLSIMEDYLLNNPGKPGQHSVLAAMGPAFCSELVLLQW
jgi:alkylresorcinol/alkylpyrone synthase